jgi:hypothetical protein
LGLEPGHDWWSEIRSLGVFGRAWSIGIVLFSAARALVAWPTLANYGVNPWVFLAVDLITAPPYGIAQAVTVKILRSPDRSPGDAVPWATVVVLMFLAPYAYIFLAGGDRPPGYIYLGVVLWMVLFGVLATLRMRRQIREPQDHSSASPF